MPRKPAHPCRIPGCPNGSTCPAHAPKPWQGSTRTKHVGSGWQQQRDNQRILHRHRFVCHVCHGLGAMQVDHVIPLAEGGADTDSNKRPIHAVPCHMIKTNEEAKRGRSHAR